MDSRYADILTIDYPHNNHIPRLSSAERAAQFLPFAALNGHMSALEEAARLTEPERDLTAAAIDERNRRLNALMMSPENQRQAIVTYFVRDQKKCGGAYCRRSATILSFDPQSGTITLAPDLKIPIASIYSIECAGFDW